MARLDGGPLDLIPTDDLPGRFIERYGVEMRAVRKEGVP